LTRAIVEHIAREMADVLYVVFGTALGLRDRPRRRTFAEVHRAAMDKMRAGLRREDGKIIKPPGFVPPDMTSAVQPLHS
jgi:predicted HAD superfamily Cof-like phosphohydrolase